MLSYARIKKTAISAGRWGRRDGKAGRTDGFSLIEVMVAMSMSGLVIMVLYSMVSYGLSMVKSRRESTAATQAIIDQFERVRLLTWSQLTNSAAYPRVYEYTNGISGTKYNVMISVGDVPNTLFADSPSYQRYLSLVTVHVEWGDNQRSMEGSALVAQYGLQGFVKHDIE